MNYDTGFGMCTLKREGSVMVFETDDGRDNLNFSPPWKKEGPYYVLYGVPEWVKTVLTQPFNMGG